MAFGLSAGATALLGAVAAPVIGSMLADDNGAGAANDSAAAANAMQSRIAKEQWDRYKSVYAPLEDKMVQEAQDYDNPINYSKAAGEASAMVSSQFGKARDRLTRTPGLDPSSGAYQSGLLGLNLAQAASDATQQNMARTRVKDTAYARKTDALSLGKGLPASATSNLNSVTQNSMALAQNGQAQGNAQAAAIGRITDRVISSPTVSNWLNGNSSGANYSLSNGGGNPGIRAPSSSGSNFSLGNVDYSIF